jgi:hypothetical protein
MQQVSSPLPKKLGSSTLVLRKVDRYFSGNPGLVF